MVFVPGNQGQQTVVSGSSTEAKYRVMANVTSEITWIFGFLKVLRVEHRVLRCDNHATPHIATNADFIMKNETHQIQTAIVCARRRRQLS